MSYAPPPPRPPKSTAFWVVTGFAGLVAVIVTLMFAFPIYDRYQSRADRNQNRTQSRLDANNEVTLNQIKIRTFQQRVKIAGQQADIREANAIGIRKAQDEISKTLTPLYVQFEEIDALRQIAVSGRNATVIYVPIGSDGKPIVQQTNPIGGKTNGK